MSDKPRTLLSLLRDMRKLALEASTLNCNYEDVAVQAENLLIETIVLMREKPKITRERIRIITDEIIHRYKEVRTREPIPRDRS